MRCSMLETTDAMIGFNEDNAIIRPGLIERAESIHAIKSGFEAGRTKNL